MKTYRHTREGMVEDPAGAFVRRAEAEAVIAVQRDGLSAIAEAVRPLRPTGLRGGAISTVYDAATRALLKAGSMVEAGRQDTSG